MEARGSDFEPKFWPNTHFRRVPKAAAAEWILCAISSSSVRDEEEMPQIESDRTKIPKSVCERDNAEGVVNRERKSVAACRGYIYIYMYIYIRSLSI